MGVSWIIIIKNNKVMNKERIWILMGVVPGMTLGMWLRGAWFCVALLLFGGADRSPLWGVAVLLVHLVVAGLAVYGDRGRWKRVADRINEF